MASGRGLAPSEVQAAVYRRLAEHHFPQPPSTTWHLRYGPRSETMIDEAKRARLLVLGHRRPQPLLGSTLLGVLSRGVGQVVVVPASWRFGRRRTGHFVVGTKDDTDARRVLDIALKLAVRQRCTVRVIRAIEQPAPRKGRSLLDETHRLETVALNRLRVALAASLRRHPDAVVESESIQGDPAVILSHAARDADLLVIGGRPRYGLPTMIGSTTESIMMEVDRPVLVVRPGSLRLRLRPLFQGVRGNRSQRARPLVRS